MVGLAAFYACSDKETPQPVEDSARVDQLRDELRSLQQQVLASQATYSADSMNEASLTAEIKKLNAIYAKSVTYTVVVTDLQGNNLADANVKVTQAGVVATAKTDANGIAKFDNMHGGIIAGSADLNGFATLIFTADIRDGNSGSSYAASSRVSLLPLGGTPASEKGMYTLNLDVFADYTVLDDTLGGPNYWDGSDIDKALPFGLPYGPNSDNPFVQYTKVTDKKVSILPMEYSFRQVWSQLFTTGGVGAILTIAYENALIQVSSATNGTYSIKVPAKTTNFSFAYTINFEEFIADYTELLPGGEVLVDKPYDPTIKVSQVYRATPITVSSGSLQLPGSTVSMNALYYHSNN